MRTDELIADLSTELKPVRHGALSRILAIGLACGALATGLLTVLWLGVRPDIAFASTTPAFWMKAAYTLILTLVGFLLVEQAGRPGARLWPMTGLVLVAFAIIAVVGTMQMVHAPKATVVQNDVGRLVQGLPLADHGPIAADRPVRRSSHTADGADAADAGGRGGRAVGWGGGGQPLRPALHRDLGDVRSGLVQPRYRGRSIYRRHLRPLRSALVIQVGPR